MTVREGTIPRGAGLQLPLPALLLLMVTSAGLACVLQLKDPVAADAFLSLVLPLTGLCCLGLLLGRVLGGEVEFPTAASILLLLGAALQCLLEPDYGPTLARIWWVAGFCGGLSLAGWILGGYRLCRQRPQLILALLAAVNLFLISLLLLFGTELGGTRAWLSLGGGSIQLTELTKLTTVLYYGLLYAQKTWKESRRFLLAWAYLLLTGGGLLLLNELGTLLLLLALHLVLCFLFLQEMRYTALNLGGLAGLGTLGLLTLYACHGLAARRVLAGLETPILLEKAASIWDKLLLRFSLLGNLDGLDPYGPAYQGLQARNAMLLGGAFGSDGGAYVPVAESDFIFVYLIYRLGLVFSILTLILFIWLFAAGIRQYLATRDPLEQAVSAAMVCSIFLQFLVMVFGSTGFFLLTGVPVPFLSRAGTYSVVLGVMLTFLLYSGRKQDLPQIRRFYRRKSKGGRQHV